MSSCQRSFAIAKTNPTNIFTPNTLSYYDTVLGVYLPIPYTLKDGLLDIAIQDNVTSNILTDSSFNDGTFPDSGKFNSQPDYQASIMGGLSPVSSLGPNMITFLKNFINFKKNDHNAESGLTTDISIYIPGTMIKLRMNDIDWEDTYQFDALPPIEGAFDLISRRENYGAVWIFKSPLVIKFRNDGEVNYLTMTSACDAT